jgi:hypothetical protein
VPTFLNFDRQCCPSSACRHLLPVYGEKEEGCDDEAYPATAATSEIIGESDLLPIHGEKMPAGR